MQTQIQQALLAWFSTHARNLPWRQTRDPYRIMVSEVMLQQTQVDRVIPKYHAFLEAFPSLEALANAPTSDVIRAWSGLGYNRRAVNMQRAARVVLEQHGGRFPSDMAALLKLPGIGPYTAGAIACFAFEQDVAFVDTNIRRVVQRLFVDPELQPQLGDAQLLSIAEEVIPPGSGWTWNQAIMELGALICTATAPACWRCPVQPYCRDYAARRTLDEQVFEQVATARPARRVAERRETPFAGSSRFYRGRIIEVLRQLPPDRPLALAELGPLIKDDFGAQEHEWLQSLVEGLSRDGLLEVVDQAVKLPD